MKASELFHKCEEKLQKCCTPDIIKGLGEKEILVFGFKPGGDDESGDAKTVLERIGVTKDPVEGMAGTNYAIPVVPSEGLANSIARFVEFARSHPEIIFYVSPSGFYDEETGSSSVALMFKDAVVLDNVYLPATFIKAIKKSIIIPEDEPLPIKYIDEDVSVANLQGRLMGLYAEISKRTEQPITPDDEIMKKEHFMIFAYSRVIKVMTGEEERVMQALIDEIKRLNELGADKDSDKGIMKALNFMIGWKTDAVKMFEEGGSIYDLLSFTNPLLAQQKETKGYHGKLDIDILSVFDENGKYGLKNQDGTVVVPCDYDKINHAVWRGRGWYLEKNGKWGAVNERGEWMFPVEYDDIKDRLEGGHFLTKNSKMGFSNSEGVLTIDFLYDKLVNYSSSWDGAEAKLGEKWGYVDKDGNVVVPIEYDYVSLCADGMIKVEKDNKYGFYNIKGRIVIDIIYDYANDFTSSFPGVTVVRKNNKSGVINLYGGPVLPLEYEDIIIDAPNVYRVKKDGTFGIIDRDGNVLFPFKYKDLGSFDNEGVAYAANDAYLYGYVDKDDHVLIPFQYLRAENFKGKYAIVSMSGQRKGVIDRCGTVVVPLSFNYVYISSWNDVAEVESKGKKGVYDLKNGYYLPCIFKKVRPGERDKEGVLECKCWKELDSEPIVIKINNAFADNARQKAADMNMSMCVVEEKAMREAEEKAWAVRRVEEISETVQPSIRRKRHAPIDTYLPKPIKKGSWLFRFSSYDYVYSSVFAPAEAKKGARFLVQVYLHLFEETEEVKNLAVESDENARRCDYTPLNCKLRRGDAVDVVLSIYGEQLLMTQKKTLIWQGSFTKCSFDSLVPKDIETDALSCTAVLTVNGAQVGEMMFVVRIVENPQKLHPKVFSRQYRKIFISYAHQDVDKVRMIARAYAAQGVDYFFDRDNLKPGAIFPLEIKKYIDDADLFILCWSANAAKSKYVMKELEHALERAYPKIKPIEKAPLSIYPMSIEPRADELPENMKNLYNFEII